MRLKNLVTSAMAVAVMLASNLATVSAQEREQDGRQGGRPAGGRFGGPGMMFGQGGDQLLITLLARESVREELKLGADQVDGLRKLAERLRPPRTDFDYRTASEAERTKFAAQMREEAAKRAAETRKHLEQLLLPDQFERLEQISLQVQGPSALVNPDVAEKAGLSKSETEKLKKEMEASAEKSREMMAAAVREGSFEGIREKAQAMRKELDDKLVSHLTAEQKAKFEELKGAPFDMPEAVGAFGRGAPGGFGGRPGGAGGRGGFGDRRGDEGEGRRGGEGEGRRGGDRDRNE